MKRFIPNMYKKSIFEINYKKLKQQNIKVLLFDFDNTIIEKGNNIVNKKTITLFNKLKKDFLIYVVSNSLNTNKLNIVCKKLEIPYIGDSRKPFKKGYKSLSFKHIKNNQIAMIGDQLMTDVWGANRMGYISVLIDPMTNNELIWTKLTRVLEKIIFKINNKKIERGNYYD